jgi:hypothetical protein
MIRLVIFQGILVTNQQLPSLQALLLITIELIYMILNFLKYLQSRHLKSKAKFFTKLA